MKAWENYSYVGRWNISISPGKSKFTPTYLNLLFLSYFRLLSCNVLGEDEHRDQLEQPLELSDIMPLASKTYDKMRPPKYKGTKKLLTSAKESRSVFCQVEPFPWVKCIKEAKLFFYDDEFRVEEICEYLICSEISTES